MKKEWQNPTLEVLDVKMTMGQSDGNVTDNDFPAGTPKDLLTFS
jgi:hypothetical protein